MRRWLEMGRFMQETGWREGWLEGKKDSLHDVMRENKRKETAVAQLVLSRERNREGHLLCCIGPLS